MDIDRPEISRAFTNVGKAQAAKTAIEFLGEELIGKQARLDEIMYRKLEHGETVDPQFALQLWMQKWAIWQFMVKLLQTMKTGEGSARLIAPFMDIEGEING